MSRHNSLNFLPAMAAAMLLASFADRALAISLSITSAPDSTTASLTGGGSGDRAEGHTLSITNAGTSTPDTVSATVNAATRFIATVASDRSVAVSGGSAQAQDNVNYTVNFTVTPGTPATTYMVNIGTSILGAASVFDDALGASQGGNADMGNVSGFLNGSGVANPNLSMTSLAHQGNALSPTSAEVQFSDSDNLLLGPFSGVQAFSVKFTWQMTANSPQAVNGGDEMAVRLGFHNPLGGATVDDYPGPSGINRTQANDGHFVNISAIVQTVPEPSTLALAAMGILALVAARLRRRA